MRVMSFPFLMRSGRRPGLESPSNQGRGTKWSVAPEGVWQRGGRRALERRGRETQGSLEQRKRPTLWVGRLPPGSGTERPIPESKVEGSRPSGLAPCPRRSLWRVQRSGIPTLSAPAGGTPASWLPGRLCGFGDEHGPQRSEDRAQGGKDTRPGGIAGRYEHGEAVPRSGGTGLFFRSLRRTRSHGLERPSTGGA